ncbi:GAF domain-containing protein [Kitasatospora sp. NPDC048365]|uniref:GAF domain-containing protein n=1 Tax=Kitasatospora sp. NPDC048365 TaxID=3364050 RepID=UPI00371B5E4D
MCAAPDHKPRQSAARTRRQGPTRARCTHERRAGVLIYRLTGEPDQETPAALAFNQSLDGVRAVVVDLSDVAFFYSITLNALLRLRRTADARHVDVHLAGVREVADRVLQVTETDHLFVQHTDLDGALRHLMAPAPAPDPDPAEEATAGSASNEAFADVTQTLVDDFDLADTLDRIIGHCARTCGAAGAGLVIQDAEEKLRSLACTDEPVRTLERRQTSTGEGPCIDCVRAGYAVLTDDLEADRARWPRFAAAALDAGFTGARAFPLRHRGRTIGALDLFDHADSPADDTIRIAQAFADLAVLAVIQSHEDTGAHIAQALRDRAAIERAAGMLAQAARTTPEEGRALLRSRAARTGLGITAVAHALVSGRTTSAQILSPPAGPTVLEGRRDG